MVMPYFSLERRSNNSGLSEAARSHKSLPKSLLRDPRSNEFVQENVLVNFVGKGQHNISSRVSLANAIIIETAVLEEDRRQQQ